MGTSFNAKISAFASRDHPHAYGDKTSGYFPSVTGRGSSPRVWGQDRLCKRYSQVTRIIPTRMGTSSDDVSDLTLCKDHPHAYGDKSAFTLRRERR